MFIFCNTFNCQYYHNHILHLSVRFSSLSLPPPFKSHIPLQDRPIIYVPFSCIIFSQHFLSQKSNLEFCVYFLWHVYLPILLMQLFQSVCHSSPTVLFKTSHSHKQLGLSLITISHVFSPKIPQKAFQVEFARMLLQTMLQNIVYWILILTI